MDDHDLGAVLDASVPAQPASDATLTRIHHRAAQRRRRSAVLSGALSVAVVAVAALGVTWVGGSSKQVTPGRGTTTNSVPAGTTTIVPDGRCFSGDVTVRIDSHPQVSGTATRWAIVATTRSDSPCRLVGAFTASISETGFGGGRVGQSFDNPEYATELQPRTPTVVAYFAWNHPCSDRPAELDVTGISAVPANLAIPRQRCASKPKGTSSFLIEPPLVVGGPCPAGSITLTIDPDPERTGSTLHWAITGTAHNDVACRTHGLKAKIENADGTVLGVSGNPAVQNDVFEDIYSPSKPEIADYLSWSNPCSDGPVLLVVTFSDGSNGPPARLTLPRQPCTAGAISRFKITGPTQFQIDTSTTTAKP